MIQPCPICGRPNDSENHDPGWYFVCPGLCGYRLVWATITEGLIRLEVVPEDMYETPSI